MSALHDFAPAKVNLCLYLGPTRADGLHELVSLVQPLTLGDDLALEPRDDGGTEDEVVCPGVDGPNLAARALAELRAATGWDGPPQRLTITKRTPVAAGMGGGSSDAAAALRLAARASGMSEDDPVLAEIAPRLGADVSALLHPTLTLVEGAGERVRTLRPLPPFALAVLPARDGLATVDVYREADRLMLARSAEELDTRRTELEARLAEDGDGLTAALFDNDLERAACSLQPEIDDALAALRDARADSALVSGSGPTAVGVFEGADGVERASRVVAALRERHPGAVVAEPYEVAR